MEIKLNRATISLPLLKPRSPNQCKERLDPPPRARTFGDKTKNLFLTTARFTETKGHGVVSVPLPGEQADVLAGVQLALVLRFSVSEQGRGHIYCLRRGGKTFNRSGGRPLARTCTS